MSMPLMGCGSGGGFNPLSLNPTLLALPENSFSRTGGQFTAASSQYLSVASNSSVQSGGRFWFSFWVYFDADPFTQHIICKGNIGGNSVFEYAMFVLSGVFRLSIGNGVAITGLNHTFNPAATTWYHCFGFGEAGGTMGMLIDGANLITASAPATFLDGTGSLGLGYQVDGGIGYHNGRIDNVLFGKPSTSLGDGTSGSLAHTIATTLFNSNNGLPFQDITPQQQSDWGIVSGWLDNSLTADAFGSNTLTNNNGVTQAAGKVNAVAVDNDPTYFVNDASTNDNDLTQVTLANRPLYDAVVPAINNEPAWVFDGTNDHMDFTPTFSLAYPFALYFVFKANSTSDGTIFSIGDGLTEFGLRVVSNMLRAYTFVSAPSYQSETAFTDTTNWHYASAVFESTTKRTLYLDGIAATTNTQSQSVTLSPSLGRLGLRTIGGASLFSGSVSYGVIVPDWTLEKQQSLDSYVTNLFGL